MFNIVPGNGGSGNGGGLPYRLQTTDKFGVPVSTWRDQLHCDLSAPVKTAASRPEDSEAIENAVSSGNAEGLFEYLRNSVAGMEFDRLRSVVAEIAARTGSRAPLLGIEALTLAMDRRYPTGAKKRSSVLTILREGLERAGLTVYGGRNAPYIWIRTPAGVSSWDFFDRLLAEAHVVGVPGSGFGPSGEGYFRVTAFGSPADSIEAVDRIATRLRG